MLRAGLWHRGMTRLVTAENPDPGKNWKVQVPTTPEGVWWRLKAAAFNLLTSGTVNTRSPRLFIASADVTQLPGTVEQLQGSYVVNNALATQAAAVEGFYFFYEGSTKSGAGSAQGDLPSDMRIQPGHYIGSICGLLDATDQFRCVRLLIEEWLYEPPAERTSNIGDASDANRVDVIKLNKTMERIAQLLEAQQATP